MFGRASKMNRKKMFHFYQKTSSSEHQQQRQQLVRLHHPSPGRTSPEYSQGQLYKLRRRQHYPQQHPDQVSVSQILLDYMGAPNV